MYIDLDDSFEHRVLAVGKLAITFLYIFIAVTTSFGRVCAGERITVYCIGNSSIEWTSDLAIGRTSISFQMGLDMPEDRQTRRNATAQLVSVEISARTINSSLTYNANDGVVINCADGNGESSEYVHPLYQRRL